MKKTIALFLALVLCLSLCACGKKSVEGKGYDTPEEALLAYAEALQSGDVDEILSTFAVETFVANYNLEEYVDYVNAYMINSGYLPNVGDYTDQINLISRQAQITRNLSYVYTSVAFGEAVTYYITMDGNPYDDADDLMDDLKMDDWAETLSEMKISDDFQYLEDISEDFYDEDWLDKTEDNLDNQCNNYGCEEIIPLGLEIELDGEDYVLFMDVACYEGKWYNLNQIGTMGYALGYDPLTGGLCQEN